MESKLSRSIFFDKFDSEDDDISINKKKDNDIHSGKLLNSSNDSLKIPNIEKSTSQISINTVATNDSVNTLGEINIVEIDNENENTLNLPCINLHQKKNVSPKKKSSDSNETLNINNNNADFKVNVIKNSRNSNGLSKPSEESLLFKKTNILPKNIIDETNNHITKKDSRQSFVSLREKKKSEKSILIDIYDNDTYFNKEENENKENIKNKLNFDNDDNSNDNNDNGFIIKSYIKSERKVNNIKRDTKSSIKSRSLKTRKKKSKSRIFDADNENNNENNDNNNDNNDNNSNNNNNNNSNNDNDYNVSMPKINSKDKIEFQTIASSMKLLTKKPKKKRSKKKILIKEVKIVNEDDVLNSINASEITGKSNKTDKKSKKSKNDKSRKKDIDKKNSKNKVLKKHSKNSINDNENRKISTENINNDKNISNNSIDTKKVINDDKSNTKITDNTSNNTNTATSNSKSNTNDQAGKLTESKSLKNEKMNMKTNNDNKEKTTTITPHQKVDKNVLLSKKQTKSSNAKIKKIVNKYNSTSKSNSNNSLSKKLNNSMLNKIFEKKTNRYLYDFNDIDTGITDFSSTEKYSEKQSLSDRKNYIWLQKRAEVMFINELLHFIEKEKDQ